MPKTRVQLRRKVKQSQHLLELANEYLKEAGSVYIGRDDSLADRFALIFSAIEEIKCAIDSLLEEM